MEDVWKTLTEFLVFLKRLYKKTYSIYKFTVSRRTNVFCFADLKIMFYEGL